MPRRHPKKSRLKVAKELLMWAARAEVGMGIGWVRRMVHTHSSRKTRNVMRRAGSSKSHNGSFEVFRPRR